MSESPNNTVISPSYITDASGGFWTIIESPSYGGQVCHNGVVDKATRHVVLLLYYNQNIYHENASGEWYVHGSRGWNQTSDPRITGNKQIGSRPCLVGVWKTETDSPAFHTYMGYHPDFTINHSYYGPDYSYGGWLGNNHGYPAVVATAHYGGSQGTYVSPYTAQGAANGSYFGSNGAITQGMQKYFSPYASTVYAIRLSREWIFDTNDYSPFHGSGVDPITWVTGWNNYAKQLKALYPDIKIAWDYPVGNKHANALDYYPGDEYVDIISCDIYFVEYWYGSSANCWKTFTTQLFNLNTWATFAAQHNKPIAVWEWGDNYGDGYCTGHFDAWMKQCGVVAHCYWNSTALAANGGNSCALLASTNVGTKRQFTADWSSAATSATYTGSYWNRKPLPASMPSGY